MCEALSITSQCTYGYCNDCGVIMHGCLALLIWTVHYRCKVHDSLVNLLY